MTSLLSGRSAIVTGAGSGIGRDLALSLAAAGARVGVGVRRIETGEETVAMVTAAGGEALPIALDVTDDRVIASAVPTIADRFGGIDIVIHNANNAASALPTAAMEITPESWDAQAAVTLQGAFAMAKSCHPYLRASGRGRFVVMTSAFGYHGAAMNTIYAAQKSSFRGLIKSLAREWGGDEITVNSIAPAAATEATRLFFDQNPPCKAAYLRKFPLGRMGDPRADIAEAAVALCSDALSYMTGQTLFMDGGLYPSA
ncbi:SDR family NAD(P)-dependent oxidoreductase [Sphingomonas sp. ID0503]|uniref:SDR family NAD(P)-dependent oxidoreductase n=1 Tax=Sphingomonas sp. ID0503 TaxID=3399691 RepID=UPI003AFA186B